MFKVAMEKFSSPDMKLIIRADKTPVGEHERRFNAPVHDEVAVVLSGDQCSNRDIVLEQRNHALKRITETHPCYDPLQYPVLFPTGQHGYRFDMKQTDPQTREELRKNISCQDYYAYRLMLRKISANHLHRCSQLFNQYLVDVYAKVETERLLFIKLNQKKLRVENYVHLRDAIINDAANPREVGQMTILPSTFTGM